MKKLLTAMMTMGLLGAVTIAPLGASAGVVERVFITEGVLAGQAPPGTDDDTVVADTGEIICGPKNTTTSLKQGLFRIVGGRLGELRGVVKMGNNTIDGFSMRFRTNGPGLKISDNDGNIDLRYDARPEYRIKNTSALPGRGRVAGGQAWIGLAASGERSRNFNFTFMSGFASDRKRGLIPMVQAGSSPGNDGYGGKSFDFNCRI